MNRYSKRKLFNDDSSPSSIFKKYVVFILIFGVMLLLISLLLGAFLFKSDNPTSKISLCAYLSLFISAFISAFIFSKSFSEKNLMHGVIFGAIISLISLIPSFFGNADADFKADFFIKLSVIIITAIASVLGAKKPKKHKKFKR